MVKVIVYKNNNLIENITIKGHANYNEYGKDIVCASLSSIVITTVNALIRFDQTYLDYEENDGYMNLQIKKHDNIGNVLLENMLVLIKQLEKTYPNNIKIIESK